MSNNSRTIFIYDEVGHYMETGELYPLPGEGAVMGEAKRAASREDQYPQHGRFASNPFADDTEFVREDKARVAEDATRSLKVSEVVHKIATLTGKKKALDAEIEDAKDELKGLTVKDTDYQVGGSKVSVYTVTRRTFNVPKLKTMITPELFAEVTKTTIDTKMVDKAFEAGRITPSEMVSVVTFKDSKAIKVTTKPEGDTA